MTLTHEELQFLIRGLDHLGNRYMEDYRLYHKQDNDEAANDCLDYFHRVMELQRNLIALSQNGTIVVEVRKENN